MIDDVTKAIQSAKYNESVEVTVTVTDDEGNSAPREISLVATLDEENGGIQWVQGDTDHRLHRHVRTKRWLFPMLNDHHRNELYSQAIQRAAKQISFNRRTNKDSPTPQRIHSLDIGSGTGLLAMISAKALKRECKELEVHVTSLEMSSAMAQIARETVASNNKELPETPSSIKILEGHSCETSPLEPKALLCTSELLESGLLGEGWLPALRDAWERHLDPENAVVVPQAAKVYAQVVEGEGVTRFWGPHKKCDNLSLTLDTEGTSFLLGDGKAGVQVPVHASKLLRDTKYPIRFLSDPVECLEIRVDSKETTPPPEGRTQSTTFIPTSTGVAHGILFWWKLDLFGEDLSYKTGPSAGPWQDHWQQCLYVFTNPPEECLRLEHGEAATLHVFHNDNSISFGILPGETSKEDSGKRPRPSRSTMQKISPCRAWQLNNVERSRTIRDGIQTLLAQRGMDSVLLDLSDFSLAAIMAGLIGASNVTSLEASSSVLPESTAQIAQISNGLPLPKTTVQDSVNQFQMVRCHPEQLTLDILGGSPAGIVLAEPYYEVLEGWVVQEALNFIYILRALKKRNLVRADAAILPSYARIMGCAFESKEINTAFQKCPPSLCGFRHHVVNQYHALSDHDLSLPSWQYDIVDLTAAFQIAILHHHDGAIEVTDGSRGVAFTGKGTCHGMLVWVEYGMPSSPDGTTKVLSTRSRCYHQQIRLLQEEAVNVSPLDQFCFQASFGKGNCNGYDCHFKVAIKRSSDAGTTKI